MAPLRLKEGNSSRLAVRITYQKKRKRKRKRKSKRERTLRDLMVLELECCQNRAI